MDTSTLHTATEELAELLSEVTQGDLERRTPVASRDVGDLYLHLIDQNIRVAAAIASETVTLGDRTELMDRAALAASLDLYGGGLEMGYRQRAQILENAFGSVTLATGSAGSTGSMKRSRLPLSTGCSSATPSSTLGTSRKRWDSPISRHRMWCHGS